MYHERCSLESKPVPSIEKPTLPLPESKPLIEKNEPVKEVHTSVAPQTVGDNFVRLNLKRRLNVKHHVHSKHPKPSSDSKDTTALSPQQQQEQSGTGPGMLEEEVVSMYLHPPKPEPTPSSPSKASTVESKTTITI